MLSREYCRNLHLPLAYFRPLTVEGLIHDNAGIKVNLLLSLKICLNIVDAGENKDTTYKSFLTYAVEALCFGLRRSPSERDAAASERFCPNL